MQQMEIEQKNINIHDYIRVLLKHQWTILTVFAVIVISVAIFSFTATPIYRATTKIIIEKENPKVVSFQEVMSVDSSGLDYYQTQYKIIESRAVANEVIKRLKLDQSEEFVPKPGILSDILETIMSPIEYIKSLLKTEKPEAPFSQEEGLSEPSSPLVPQFINRVKVIPIRNSRLVDLSFEAKDPVLAAKIANTIASAYINLTLQTKLKATQNAVNWLNQQVEQEKKKVEQAEQALLKYKQQQGIVTDFSTNVETITAQRLAELNRQVVEATSRRVEAETRFRQARQLESNPESMGSIPEVLQNPLVQDIKKQEVELYKKLSELSKRYGIKHPQIIALNNELKTLNSRKIAEIQRIVNALQNEYRVALAREGSLKGALGQQKGETLSLNEKAIDYNVLKREAETSKEMFDVLIKRFKETSLTEDIRTGNIRIIDPAEIPKEPVKPKKTQNILLAIFVGLSMGVGLAFFLEHMDSTIKLPDEITRLLNIPYLGPVPALAIETDSDEKTMVERKPEDDLITLLAPKSTASESYRGIRTSLLLSSPDKAPQVILVCSAAPREGKSMTTANIAIIMAQAGGKILLVDCDLRRPKLHKLFHTERDKGISNILAGSCSMDEAIIHTQVPNVDLIPCGPIPPNPSEILSSHHMKELIEQARIRYERIIIDSPPITAVTDAVILSSFVDGAVIVIRAGDTHREIIKNGIAQLRAVNAHILGALLNGVEMGRDSYYYYQYYYYYYGEDGDKRKKTRQKKTSGRYEEFAETAKDYGSKIKHAWLKEQGANIKKIWNNKRDHQS